MFKGLLPNAAALEPMSLDSAVIQDSSGLCDPSEGEGRLQWVTTGDRPGSVIEFAYDVGSGYVVSDPALAPSLLEHNFDMTGIPGFTSLNSTNFRVRLLSAGVDLPGSPIFLTPPYSCI